MGLGVYVGVAVHERRAGDNDAGRRFWTATPVARSLAIAKGGCHQSMGAET